MAEDRFTLLFVCQANLCRSPMAERLASHILTRRIGSAMSGLSISSAGIDAYSGLPMHPLAQQVLTELGADCVDFSSRSITPGMLTGADLVLTADREQRAQCVIRVPEVLPRVFTLRQFGRLITAVNRSRLPGRSPSSRLASLALAAAAARGRVPSPAAGDDNLNDPVDRPLPAFRSCAAQIREVLEFMADAVQLG